MVDRSAEPLAGKEWETFSRQYWDALQHWQQASATAASPAGAPPWHEGLAMWVRLFGDPGGQPALAERVLSSVKAYLQQTQALLATGGGVPQEVAARFGEALQAGLRAAPGFGPGLADNALAAALRQIGGEGAKGLEQLAAGLAPMFGAVAGEARSLLDQPAFGFMRERQEHQQRTAQAAIDYQEQMARYNALILKAGQQGSARFQDKLAERGAAERPIESLRALYDLWVDAAEEGYAQIAGSAEFREIYGALVNAQMKLRSLLQQDIERLSVDLGIPTRSEVDSLGRRLQALRREVRGSGDRRAAGGADRALAAEVQALRRELAALKAAPVAPAVRVAAAPAAARPAKAVAAVKSGRGKPSPARTRAAKKAAPAKARRPAKAAGGFEARVAQFARTAKAPSPGRPAAKPAGSSDKKR